ncbi:MAG: hypothetical protein IKM07_00335 [Clostridia bacterium]|nr:hypothetical protein [Clostridia bacterium]
MQTTMIAILALSFILGCAGCAKTMDDMIAEEPRFTGIVREVQQNSILVQPLDGESVKELMNVSLDAQPGDSVCDFQVGDEVTVFYDGLIRETSPASPQKVYSVMLRTPVARG